MHNTSALSLQAVAQALGGEVRGVEVLVPGPGHSKEDRSLSIKLSRTAPDGFLCTSFSGDNPLTCKDYVRERLNLPPWKPERDNDASGDFALRGLGEPSAVWRYQYADGTEAGAVARYDSPQGKTIRPWVLSGSGWTSKAMPEPRPLYRLPELLARPETPVIVCEGEKAADAARRLFPEHVATTSAGGSKAASKADWSALRGRNVTIWPDNDTPGAAYAVDVERLARSVGAASVRVVKIPPDWPAKYDLADPLPDGVTIATLAEMLVATSPAWEPPISIGSSLPPVAVFDQEMLPEALRGYVFDVAERQQSVPDFVAVAALCGLAALIGNRVRVAPKKNDDWIEVPNLWGAIIGPPSAMKSPALQKALAPLYDIQNEQREAWKSALQDANVNDTLSNLDLKIAQKKAAQSLKSGDREGARAILAEISRGDEDPPCPRIIVNDATVEKLGELLNENPRGLLLVRDELPGFLSRMEAEEFAGERAFFLESFNGTGSFVYDRIGRGTVHIQNCTLSIIGGVQPSRLAPIVRGAVTGVTNDGFVQRLQLAVWPDGRQSWQWVDRHPNRAAQADYYAVFRKLHEFPLGSSEAPLKLRFSERAQSLFREWMVELQAEARSGKLSPVLESHLLKMPKTVASLALIFELIEGEHFEVGETATLRALAWADYLRSHANRIYAAGATLIEDGARMILERRRQLPTEFTTRDIYRRSWAGLSDREAVTAAVELLASTHHCHEIEKPTCAIGGRPTICYCWNPRLGEV